MARSAGSRQRWLIAAALALHAGAQAAVSAASGSTAAAAPVDHRDDKNIKMEKKTNPATAPDAALLEYLGRYGEAPDGIDPLAFDMPGDADRPKSADGEPR